MLSDGPRPGFNNVPGATRYAAFSVVDKGASTLDIGIGALKKLKEPLFRGTERWERNIDNGYSSVLYDPAADGPAYRVYYSASDSQFSGDIPGESAGSATLFATSHDGVSDWQKPALGRFPYDSGAGASTANNILFDGTTALAIYDDGYQESNASARYKVWGNLPGLDGQRELGYTAQLGGSAVSANGLNFTDYRRLQDPSSSASVPDTWRFDAQTSMFYDLRVRRYVGTMRAFRPCSSCGTCPIWWQPHSGCQAELSSTCTAAQCNRTVRAIATSSTKPDEDFQRATWGKSVEVFADHDDPTHQYYSQVTFPFYNGYLGIVMVFSAVDPPKTYGKGKVHCELAWSADGDTFERLAPGTDFVPLGSTATRDFDSHVCFASAHPVKLPNETRVYYFGGDGPHYSPAWPDPLHRNSSFGMGVLRPDGFVALRPRAGASAGTATTLPLVASGRQLTVTADTAPAGSVTISVRAPGLPGGGVTCAAVAGRNVTDEPLQGCDLSAVAEQMVTLKLEVGGGAAIYTVGFRDQ